MLRETGEDGHPQAMQLLCHHAFWCAHVDGWRGLEGFAAGCGDQLRDCSDFCQKLIAFPCIPKGCLSVIDLDAQLLCLWCLVFDFHIFFTVTKL